MPPKPTGPPTVRMYNVGFGDCFLLTFRYGNGSERHMLMDFGTTTLSKKRGPKDMAQVAEQIREDTDRDLVLSAQEAVDYGLADAILDTRKLALR